MQWDRPTCRAPLGRATARCAARRCIWSVAAGPTGFTRGGADRVYARRADRVYVHARRGRRGLRASASGPTGFTRERGGADGVTRERGGADGVYARARRGRPGLRAAGGADGVYALSDGPKAARRRRTVGAQGRVEHRARGAAGGGRVAEVEDTVSAAAAA